MMNNDKDYAASMQIKKGRKQRAGVKLERENIQKKKEKSCQKP